MDPQVTQITEQILREKEQYWWLTHLDFKVSHKIEPIRIYGGYLKIDLWTIGADQSAPK
jgi:hypothetical protein